MEANCQEQGDPQDRPGKMVSKNRSWHRHGTTSLVRVLSRTPKRPTCFSLPRTPTLGVVRDPGREHSVKMPIETGLALVLYPVRVALTRSISKSRLGLVKGRRPWDCLTSGKAKSAERVRRCLI